MRVLILGGTTEASALAAALAGDARFAATLSLAGVTRAPRAPPIPLRLGGFGGAAGLAAYLHEQGVARLIDATHPFASAIKANAATAARQAGIPLLRVLRPAWTPGPGDDWTEFASMAAMAEALGPTPRRVLLTIGRKDLAPFRAAPWHRYVLRSVDPPGMDALPPDTQVISARGPFALAEELALMRRHAIDMLVTKNSGGGAVAAKLDAARALGLPVLMLARPPLADGVETVRDDRAALDWLVHGSERGV